MGIASTPSSVDTAEKPPGISLNKFLSRLIWLCVMPLLLLAAYLSMSHVWSIQAEQDLDAKNLATHFASTLDNDLSARINGLKMVALSTMVDTPSGRNNAWNEAQRFQQVFGSHVVLAGLDMQMLWNTRVPVNTKLPKLPRPKGHSAVMMALETGKPAVGDTFIGPIAKQPLIAIAVPIVREEKSVFILLTTIEVTQFQKRLEQTTLPAGWSMKVIDGKGDTIAQLMQLQPDAANDIDSPARFVAHSSTSPWSVQVEIPQKIHRLPLLAAGATLLAALLGATLISLMGGKLASKRLSKSVASLVPTSDSESSTLRIHEIDTVRKLLEQSANTREAALGALHQLNIDLSAILQAIPDLLFDVDQNGTYHGIWAQNPALLAQQREILLGHTVNEMLPAHAADTVMLALQEASKQGGSFGKIIHLDLADGTRWFELSVSIRSRGVEGESRFIFLSRDVTERKHIELALQHSEEKLRAIADNVNSVLFLKDLAGRYLYINRQYEKLFHVSNSEIQGKTDSDIFPAEMAAVLVKNDQQVIESAQTLEIEEQVQHDDCVHTYISTKIPIRDANGKIYAVCGVATDITERKQTETALRIAATAFESLEGMMVTDANSVILRVNKAYTDITGYTAEETIGQTPKMLQSGRHDAAFYRSMWETVNRTGGWQGEVWDRRKNGEEYQKWLNISAVKDEKGCVTHYVGTHYDITERKTAEEKIKELAFFDPLTHLPNRTLLQDRLKQAMTASNRNSNFGAVLFIDLDDFKTLNDTLGHDKGDLLLQEVAQRLTACVREGDTVARLGGDEFVVVLGNLNADLQEAATQTEVIGKKILAAINQKYQLDHVDHRNTASVGATLFSGDDTAIDELLKQADLAMYKSKNSGRNTIRFFDPAMQNVVMKRAALEKDLHEGIQENQFSLYYQAQIVSGQLTGSEVLLRWKHPLRGMVSPADFIPLAEEIGVILPLGLWVLETACTQLALWASNPKMAHLTIAVNVSPLQFRQNDFVDQVITVINRTGANPHRLKLELTEGLLVDNVQNIIEKMVALKTQGVGFSLDDFGTGYSSLAYLKQLPLDQLKIDQSFVRDVLTDPNDAAIAKTIVALAQSLGLGVIAEGVETAAQRDFLASSGCDAYQGYFFSRPLPLEGFEEFAALQ
jgi:diguanylate cyclase (GGDEF)-like protein/PAS domain S-box-containing protein